MTVLEDEISQGIAPCHRFANIFATLIFSLQFVSACIETYFSKTRYIKNINRSRLSDELASATLHVQQLRTLYNVEHLQSSDTLVLDFQSALNHVENSLKDLQEKYMDTRIVKNFEDVDTKTVRAYTGTIDRVDWSKGDGCYLFHVVYDSDSDDEDLELWEVKKYECDV